MSEDFVPIVIHDGVPYWSLLRINTPFPVNIYNSPATERLVNWVKFTENYFILLHKLYIQTTPFFIQGEYITLSVYNVSRPAMNISYRVNIDDGGAGISANFGNNRLINQLAIYPFKDYSITFSRPYVFQKDDELVFGYKALVGATRGLQIFGDIERVRYLTSAELEIHRERIELYGGVDHGN